MLCTQASVACLHSCPMQKQNALFGKITEFFRQSDCGVGSECWISPHQVGIYQSACSLSAGPVDT
jgi:hypothetical protein